MIVVILTFRGKTEKKKDFLLKEFLKVENQFL